MDAWPLRRWLLWCLGGTVSVSLACAQGLTGSVIRGELTDSHGQRMRGAAVRLVAVGGGWTRVAVCDAGGAFGVLDVPAGVYRVSIRQPMSPVWTGSLVVEAEAGETTEMSLEIGAAESGGALRRADGRGAKAGAEAIGGAAGLQALPLPGREWEDAEAISPEARDTTLPGSGSAQDDAEADESRSAREEGETGRAATGVSFDGLPAQDHGETVDGLTVEQGFRTGPRGVAAGSSRASSGFAQAAVGRLRAEPQSFSAQAGGAAGGAVRVLSQGVTPGGAGGVLHGSAFFQAREAGWAATNPFSVVTTYGAAGTGVLLARPADSELQYGAALGRPVRLPGLGPRWRAGLFGAVEGRQRRQVLFSSPETAGFFSLSQVERSLLATRGVRSSQVNAALGYLAGLGGQGTLTAGQWLSFGRADFEPGRADALSVSYNGLRSATPATGGGQVAEGVIDRSFSTLGQSTIAVDAGTLRWTHALGPRWTNELRGQLARDVEAETPASGDGRVPGVGPGGFAPQVTIGPAGFRFGTPATLGRVAYPDERRTEVAEVSVWRFGRHLVTVGGDWSRLDDRVAGVTNAEGSFLYESGTTGGHAGGLVDWITDYTFGAQAYPNGGCPSITASVHYFCFRSYAQSFQQAEVEFVTHEIAGYAEDAIRLGPALRLTLGARWEYQLLPLPLAPDAALDAALAQGGAHGVASTASLPEDRNNVGPRVALRWSLAGTGRRPALAVHAGYGMFFGRVPGATLQAALTETGAAQTTTSIRITPKTEVGCPQVANQGFGYLCSFPYAPVGVAEVAQTRQTVLFAQRFRLPAVQRAALGVEAALGSHVQLELGYGAAWAVELPETTDLNITPSTGKESFVLQGGDGHRGLWTGQSFQVPVYTARRTAKFGPVTMVESNSNATYHSGTAAVTLRNWHGWSAHAGVAISKALDDGPLVGPSPRQNGQFDPFRNGYDKGISNLDRPWSAAGTVTYRSRVAPGRREWVRGLLGGWGAAVVGRAGSGAPYSYTLFDGTSLPGGHVSINGSGGATYLPTVGRNTLRLPMRSKVDLRASREVPLRRGAAAGGRDWAVELHADGFNLLNTVSLSRVETRAFLVGEPESVEGMTPLVFQDAATVATEGLAVPAFGTPLSSTTGLSRERTVEVGARLRW